MYCVLAQRWRPSTCFPLPSVNHLSAHRSFGEAGDVDVAKQTRALGDGFGGTVLNAMVVIRDTCLTRLVLTIAGLNIETIIAGAPYHHDAQYVTIP